MSETNQPHRRGRATARAAAVAAILLAVEALPVHAALTREACLVKKRAAWSAYRVCLAAANEKTLLAQPANPAPCKTALLAKLFRLTSRAKDGAIECRYRTNGDGTVTDFDTGLMWEQKTDDGSVHDKDDVFGWSNGGGNFSVPDGTVFSAFIGKLNACTDDTTSPPRGLAGGFAGHCDWRLPSVVELQTIVQARAAGDSSQGAFIDQTAFGPTTPYIYVTGTTYAPSPNFAWYVSFADGSVSTVGKNYDVFARAVRGAW